MVYAEWVLKHYEDIPEDKRHFYSEDKLIAAVCYYRTKHNIHPKCLSEVEAKAFVEAMVMQANVEETKKKEARRLTEKSIMHDMKRNLPQNTVIDEVFEKCSKLLDEVEQIKPDEVKAESVYDLLLESGVVDPAAAGKLADKIVQQHKVKDEKKQEPKYHKFNEEYKELFNYKFFTKEEVEAVKKKSVEVTKNSSLHLRKEAIVKIVMEVIKIIEEIKAGGQER